ncbi:MAG: copper resistance protein CopC, partial [Acidobacteria bacterium]|nr:copper resistance protein CopC [Acidobacteriota bacterium]
MLSRLARRSAPLLLALSLPIVAAPAAFAHAILVEATPAAGATVAGPDLAIRLRFNSRIDGARSHLTLVRGDRQERVVTLEPQHAPQLLTAKLAGVAPGAYKLRWQ